jgi:hypothetical protein
LVFYGEKNLDTFRLQIIHLATPWLKNLVATPKYQDVRYLNGCYLDHRFSPFNFSVVHGFLNVVPTIDEWGDCLPKFRENRDDNLVDDLLEFHEVMYQLGIHHEYVLMKIFMYSLKGEA